MKNIITITRWIYNSKNEELKEAIAPCEETEKTVDIEVVSVISETDKAIRITTTDYELNVVSIWLPKSQIVKGLENLKTESKVQRTTSEKNFKNADEAQEYIDLLKKENRFVTLKIQSDSSITVVERI